MKVVIILNEKHESHQITAFFESLAASSHHVSLVFTENDLKNTKEEPSFDNLKIPAHLLRYVSDVIYESAGGTQVVLK